MSNLKHYILFENTFGIGKNIKNSNKNGLKKSHLWKPILSGINLVALK